MVAVPHAADEKASLHHGALSADGKRFFVCRDGGHGVAVIDVATRQVVGEIATRPGPGHAVRGPDGARLFGLGEVRTPRRRDAARC